MMEMKRTNKKNLTYKPFQNLKELLMKRKRMKNKGGNRNAKQTTKQSRINRNSRKG